MPQIGLQSEVITLVIGFFGIVDIHLHYLRPYDCHKNPGW